MKTFNLTHDHRHGADTYTFRSSRDRTIYIHHECYNDRSEIEDIISYFNIDFEQRYSETIDISEVTENIPIID